MRTQAPSLERVQVQQARGTEAAPAPAPSSVRDALASPGHPLDAATRGFMEPRFGRDFSQVRVHTDASAAKSAREIDALAYTAAQDIVFDSGQYAPHTTAGRSLLAHELAHVAQGGPREVIRRRRSGRDARARKRDAQLKAMAGDPSDAHKAWKRLAIMEKVAVVVQMTNRYGIDFSKSFLAYTRSHKKSLDQTVSNAEEHTPKWFQERGYRLRQRSQGAAPEQTVEWWVHPSGHEFMQIVTGHREIPYVEDCGPLTEATLEIARAAVDADTQAKTDLEVEKAALEKMNKTTDDYCERYDSYIGSLKALHDGIVSEIEDIELMHEQLVEMKCPVDKIDSYLDQLRELEIAVGIELHPMSTQFLQCIKIGPPLALPADDDE